MNQRELNPCPICTNQYLAIRTDIYKDKREFVYCDCCGAMATKPMWQSAQAQQPTCKPALQVEQATTAQEPAPCPTCEALARTVMLDQTGHDDYYKRMFEAAVSSLAKIDQLLGINDDGCGGSEETIEAVRELVEEQATTAQEQFPAWQYKIDVHGCHRFYSDEEDYPEGCTPLYTHPAPVATAREPVARVAGWYAEYQCIDSLTSAVLPVGMALYSAAPQHKPLTDEQIENLHWGEMSNRDLSFARAVEAAITKVGE